MELYKRLEKDWELVFAFGPLTIALISFLIMTAATAMFNLPAPLDMEPYMAQNAGQSFGITIFNILWPAFIVCGLLAVPFLIAGLTIFGLRKLRTRQQEKSP